MNRLMKDRESAAHRCFGRRGGRCWAWGFRGWSFAGENIAPGDYPAIGPLPETKAPKASLVEMGKRLFFDARMSGDGGISCATCHDPREGFGKSNRRQRQATATLRCLSGHQVLPQRSDPGQCLATRLISP